MNQPFARERRFAVALVALILGALLFRAQLAQSLVVRGDDFMYRGQSARALSRYSRALYFDPSLGLAADRFVFLAMQLRDKDSLKSAFEVANRYLARNPDDAGVLSDRAMCYLVERQYGRARADFERAAHLQRNARDYVFAGWAAVHSGDVNGARTLWHVALAVDPQFRPAALALAEHPQ